MKTCHGTSNLTDNGVFLHNGKEHRKFICGKCGQHWQWSPSYGYYQIRGKSGREVKRVHSVRVTDTAHKKIIERYGSLQKYFDDCLRKDGIS